MTSLRTGLEVIGWYLQVGDVGGVNAVVAECVRVQVRAVLVLHRPVVCSVSDHVFVHAMQAGKEARGGDVLQTRDPQGLVRTSITVPNAQLQLKPGKSSGQTGHANFVAISASHMRKTTNVGP